MPCNHYIQYYPQTESRLTFSPGMRVAAAERVDLWRLLNGFEVEEARRRSTTQRGELVLSVLDVHALPSHSRQLPPFRHEHDEEHDQRTPAQPKRQARVSVPLQHHLATTQCLISHWFYK